MMQALFIIPLVIILSVFFASMYKWYKEEERKRNARKN